MTTLKLYKGVAFDGVNSFPDIPSKAVFDTYLSQKQQYTQDIHYNRIGEPILINEGYDTAIGYSYGCIDTGGKKYFIIPDSISVNENNRVYLTYSVDWFTTLEYADAIAFGRAHLIKSTDANPLGYTQGIQPIDMRITEHIPLQESEIGEIHVAYTTADDKSKIEWILSTVENGRSRPISRYIHPNTTIEGHSIGVDDIMNGALSKESTCNIPPQNIVGIYYIPFEIKSWNYRTISGEVPGKTYVWQKLNFDKDNPTFATGYTDCNLTSNAMKGVHLIDRYGSVIYSVPYGRTLKRVMYTPIISATACYIALQFFYDDDVLLPTRFYVVRGLGASPSQSELTNGWIDIAGEPLREGDVLDDADNTRVWVFGKSGWTILDGVENTVSWHFNRTLPSPRQSAENSFMLYMCEKVDYNNDAYANWASGFKGIEIEERRIQKNKGLVAGLGGAAITGAIGGAGGNPMGAAAGAAAGVAGALLSYGLDTYYESNVNSLEDRKYQLAQDTMIPGGFLQDAYHTLAIVELSASDEDIARYNDELANFGADCNLPVASWTPSVGAYKFADVEIIADVPYSVKQNIKQKMMSGIKIVGLN